MEQPCCWRSVEENYTGSERERGREGSDFSNGSEILFKGKISPTQATSKPPSWRGTVGRMSAVGASLIPTSDGSTGLTQLGGVDSEGRRTPGILTLVRENSGAWK